MVKGGKVLLSRRFTILSAFCILWLFVSPVHAVQPWLDEPGTRATYGANFRLVGLGAGDLTTYIWEHVERITTAQGNAVRFYIQFGSAGDYVDVPDATGSSIIYLPQEAFRGALQSELQLEGIGKVPVYELQVDWEGLTGTVYYDRTSYIAVRGDLAGTLQGEEYHLRFWLKSASPGLVHTIRETPAYTPTPTPQTVMGSDPMMFYTGIIVLAIVVVGAVIFFSLRRSPRGYPPPPP